MLSDERLEWLLSHLRRIPHVEFLRIGSKVPAALPQRITPALVRMLKRYHPLWMSIHFAHPDELTPEVAQACARLADAGIPLGSQTVLLAGVNDNVETMKRLLHGLLTLRVRPYYLYQCDPVSGSAHFRVPVEKGLEIIQQHNPNVQSLRDVSRVLLYEYQAKLGENLFIKCLYVVEEIARTQQAAALLQASHLKGFGKLMYETHWGLSRAYEVSCEELDLLVSIAEEDQNEVIGSRMMGGGFGGCTINLVKKGQIQIFEEKVRQKYFTTFKKEPDFYSVKLSDGVQAVYPKG